MYCIVSYHISQLDNVRWRKMFLWNDWEFGMLCDMFCFRRGAANTSHCYCHKCSQPGALTAMLVVADRDIGLAAWPSVSCWTLRDRELSHSIDRWRLHSYTSSYVCLSFCDWLHQCLMWYAKTFTTALTSPRSRRHQAGAASHILSSRSQSYFRDWVDATSHIHTDSSQSYLQWRRRL